MLWKSWSICFLPGLREDLGLFSVVVAEFG